MSVSRNTWDNVVLVTRDGSTDSTWDGKVKNLIYDVDTMAWIAQEASSGGVASSVTVTNLPANPATSTLQTTGNSTLASLLTELQAKADLSETQPVSGPLTDAQLRASAIATEGALYASRVDEASSTVTYIGKAVTGTSNGAAAWQVQRITESGAVLTIEWADGDSSFDNVWNNRASLSYS